MYSFLINLQVEWGYSFKHLKLGERRHPWLAELNKTHFPSDKTGGWQALSAHTKFQTHSSAHNCYITVYQLHCICGVKENTVIHGFILGASSHLMTPLPVCRVRLSKPLNPELVSWKTHTVQSLAAGRSLLNPSKKEKAEVYFDEWNVFV